MASNHKSLIVAVAFVATLAVCLAAPVSNNAQLQAAMDSAFGQEITDFETTQKNLEFIRDTLEPQGEEALKGMGQKVEDGFFKAAFLLFYCEKKDDPVDEELAKIIVEEAIKDERARDKSANLISYMEQCKQKHVV